MPPGEWRVRCTRAVGDCACASHPTHACCLPACVRLWSSHFETTMNDVAAMYQRITGNSLEATMASKDEKK